MTAGKTFEPNWESLTQYRCPDWFRNAKFGIWAHWGPQCVAQVGDWYARHMYIQGHAQYEHHVKAYGHPSKFGYKDIVQLWRAEKFDPEGLIELYRRVGARYFVAMGVHHDNFDCWASRHHRWNAAQVGPKKDIVGLWRQAALAAGLRFGVTEHLERSYSWFNTNKGADSEGPLAGVPYDGNDPEYEDFYFEAHQDTNAAYPVDPPEAWKQQWLARLKDLIDQYQPDLLYTDGAVPFGRVGREMVAHLYNRSIECHDGELQAVYTLKDARNFDLDHGEYVEGVGVLDLERGVVADIRPEPWQTDTCIGGWFYNRDAAYKSAQTVIHMLADIVSKNGNLLLNFPQRPDGTLDDEAHSIARGIGDWMAVNNEAIYDTRPWAVFGEGPTKFGEGNFAEREARDFTAEDFRFTTKGDALYAIALAWPDSGRLRVTSLAEGSQNAPEQISKVELLGSPAPVQWQRDQEGLHVTLPEDKPCESAFTLKVTA